MSEKDHIKPLGDLIKTGNSDSILSSMFRNILFDLGVTNARFNILLERYMSKSNLPYNMRESSSIRGNLKKELLKSTMSWKVFVKGLTFVNVRKFDMTIKLYHANGDISTHSRSVTLDPGVEDE